MRFRTLLQLQQHTNAYIERKKLLQKKKDNKEIREFRELYCKLSQWISDFNALDKRKMSTDISDQGGNSSVTGASGGTAKEDEEEFIIPADEHFQRCPISKERFECFWDDDEGELMYRHAVKILLTETADQDLFKLGRTTEGDASVRYLIVHKLLVLDKWLTEGRTVTLSDALLRYEDIGEKGVEFAFKMKLAAAGEQDDDDIFVLLDLSI